MTLCIKIKSSSYPPLFEKDWGKGSLDTPVDYYCEIAHTEARVLGLLQKDEKAWEVMDWKERIRDLSQIDHGQMQRRASWT
jgi:hypothetical protein